MDYGHVRLAAVFYGCGVEKQVVRLRGNRWRHGFEAGQWNKTQTLRGDKIQDDHYKRSYKPLLEIMIPGQCDL